jgi:hypothetical protein
LINFRFYLYFLLFFGALYGQECFFLKKTDKHIKEYILLSERCSGSNYLKYLLDANTTLTIRKDIFHKHFPPWYSLGIEFWKGNKAAFDLDKTEGLLTIFIIRDPYDWIRSLHSHQPGGGLNYREMELSSFIRSPWCLDDLYKKLHVPSNNTIPVMEIQGIDT